MTGKQRLSISTKSVTNKKLLFFFLSAFFLTQIYPFYITGAHSSLLSTLSLGKIFISVTFFIVLYSRKKELLNLYSSKKVVFTILGLFLFGESLSVLSVNDVYSFFKIYHNTILAILIFMLTAFFIKSNKNNIVVFRTFISISAISYIVFELIFRLFFSSVFPIFSQYAQKEIVDAYLYNISIFKYSLAQGPEMFLPFLLYPIASRHVGINKKALYAITSLTLFFLSMLSNFRSRVLIYFFGVFTFFCINISKKSLTVMSKKKLEFVLSIFTILILFSVSIYISTSISNTNYSFNIFDRILLQSKSLDQSSLLTRTEQYKRSVELFFSSPLIGVGLGNFGNYVNTNKILSTIIDEGTKSYTLSTLTRPHSLVFQILGETGLSGFIPFIMLLFYFLFEDVKNLKFKKHTYTSALILSSWSFILYSLYNPADTIFIMGWFWLFRGIIEGLK